MILARLWKIQSEDCWECDGKNCVHSPNYFDIVGEYYYLKKDTTCLILAFDNYKRGEVYCKDCVNNILLTLKPFLNTDLWSFI